MLHKFPSKIEIFLTFFSFGISVFDGENSTIARIFGIDAVRLESLGVTDKPCVLPSANSNLTFRLGSEGHTSRWRGMREITLKCRRRGKTIHTSARWG